MLTRIAIPDGKTGLLPQNSGASTSRSALLGDKLNLLIAESDFAPDPPDLKGCTIAEVLLVVESLNIPISGDFDAKVKWQFWGDCD